MKTKTLKQTVTFNATPHEIYEMLMDSKKHAKFTGAKASISRKVGGSISAWDGYIEGKNLELVKDKKIVQAWRSDEDGWPKDHYSIATFSLAKSAKGTKLTFTQTSLPAQCYKNIGSGWKQYYWQPMKEMLEKG